jgi:glutamine cyclotransferase
MLVLLAPLLMACSDDDKPLNGGEPEDTTHYLVPLVVRSIAHMDFNAGEALTQGLLFHDGLLYESNGGYNDSNIRTLDPADGSRVTRVLFRLLNDLELICNRDCWAEGITVKDGRIVQLLFLKRHTLSWSIPDLTFLGIEYTYNGQGWGITTVDSSFVTSHGTDTLYFRDDSFAVTRKLPVTFKAAPIDSLNELEYVNGTIYANVLGHRLIYGIDPMSGIVTTVVNCSTLVETVNVSMHTHPLNGIAYDDSTGYFYLTGKNWPLIFEVLLVEEE